MTHLDRLTCEQVFRRLDDYLDRELSPSDVRLVEAHLERCAVCAREFRFETQVLDGLRDKLKQVEVPEGLNNRIAALLEDAAESEDKPTDGS